MKKGNKDLIVAIALFLILLNTELSYCEELDQNDLQYQFKVLPMIIAATNHFNEVSARINEFVEYPNVDLAIELCKDSKTSYTTIRTLGKNIASVKPGRVYLKYSQLLSQLFALRKATVLMLMQSCASDPMFEQPDVWNSFKIRYEQLKEQLSQVSSRLDDELNNIDKSFQNEQ
ncbi:MAG: hypothetical protein WBD99_14385 [Thermodesulfobacteriota bacterium]